MAFEVPRQVRPVVDFAIQTITGAVAFALVFLVAAALAALIQSVERYVTLPAPIHATVEYAEIGIWVLDLVGLALFLIKEVATLASKLWTGWRHADG